MSFTRVSSLGSELVKSVELNPPKEHLDCEFSFRGHQGDMDSVRDIARVSEASISETVRQLVRIGLKVYLEDPEEKEAELTQFEQVLRDRA